MSSTAPSILRPMHLLELELHRPTTLGELLGLLGNGCHALAGGTDIVPAAAQQGEPRRYTWTGGVDELQAFEPNGDPILVGAAVTLARLVRSAAFRAAAPAVADGAQSIGSVQLRNQATLAGNVCTASPAGDTLPGLLVHDAAVEIAGAAGGARLVGLRDFLVGPGETALEGGELVVSVRLSRLEPGEASAYQRFTQRQALDLAFASVAARLGFEADGRTVASARLALGAVAPTALLAPEAATTLIGQPLSERALQACADVAAEACAPISDHRASADYRRQLVKALVLDVVSEAGRRAFASARVGDNS